jgi:pimeloyl-ACP methyl ester carboxylesterase
MNALDHSPILNRRSFAAVAAATLMSGLTTASATALNETRVEGPEGSLAIYKAGSGKERVLLLHSDAGRSDQWQEVVNRIADTYDVCAVDFRGHGDSDAAANGDYSFEGRAEDVLAVGDHLGWERFLLVAHSGGCAVALTVAASRPGRVRGLLLVDPVTNPRALPEKVLSDMVAGLSGPNSLDFLKRYYISIAGPDKAVQATVLTEAEATDPAARVGLGKTLVEWNPIDTLDVYKGPMLILGTDISDGPAALYSLRPNIPHRVIHGTGHWLQIERPDIVAEAISEVARQAAP